MVEGSGEGGEILVFFGSFGFSNEDSDFVVLGRLDAGLVSVTFFD